MSTTATESKNGKLVLKAATASEIMTPNPISIREDAGVREAVAFLIDKGFSAAPVIDNSGHPVGVLSRADIMTYDRSKVDYMHAVPDYYQKTDLAGGEPLPKGFQVESVDRTRVNEIMTPVVFAVSPESPVQKVVEDMVGLKVHRLFVVNSPGVLVGVISALDVLRHIQPESV